MSLCERRAAGAHADDDGFECLAKRRSGEKKSWITAAASCPNPSIPGSDNET